MKLNDLIEALANEIEMALPQMQVSLQALADLSEDTAEFMDALDQYSGQAQRMGDAAEMVGFPGLQAVCMHVVENSLLLVGATPMERAPLIEFLRPWPRLLLHHLRNLSDPSTAAGLVDHLRSAPSPMQEEQALKVMHMLGAMPSMLAGGSSTGQDSQRPVLATLEDVSLDLPADIDPNFFESFLHEAPDQAASLVSLARKIAQGDAQPDDLSTAQRLVHTLKGSGAIMGVRGLASLGHHVEDILEHFKQQGAHLVRPVAEALLDTAHGIAHIVSYLLGEEAPPAHLQATLQTVLDIANRIDRGESLEQPLTRVAPAMPETLPAKTVPITVPIGSSSAEEPHGVPRGLPPGLPQGGTQPAASLRVSVGQVEALFRVAGEVSVHNAAMESRIKALAQRANDLMAQQLRVQKRLFELEQMVDLRALALNRARHHPRERSEFDPLEMEQYSDLHATSNALFEEAADARMLATRLEAGVTDMAELQARQQRLVKNLQHLIGRTRMTPVGMLEARLQRNLYATCQATGKQAELVLEGGDTLIDSDALNRLADPLLHVLRNAVDHGLESPQERVEAGKPATGRIVLTFSHRGAQVMMRCVDDGRGLDPAAIRRRAESRGLIEPGAALDDEEIARLILRPGFSTREQVSEISGRGIGLDVVQSWAHSMNGSIRIASQPGQGCRIELRFAASLSTLHALVVGEGNHRFSVPSALVQQALPAGLGRFEASGGQLFYHHAERAYPAHRLAERVGLPSSCELDQACAVIVQLDNRPCALAVERLIDARELLLKSPGRFARHVPGVAGLSLLGDGSITVNLDVAQLLGTGRRVSAMAGPTHLAATATDAAPPQRSVLVVDDALSVRNTLLQLLRDAGFRAESARDGMDAIHVLRNFRPDVVLTDLEMPNMNGIELTSHIRSRDDLKHLPVFMLTSRSQDKHRRLAEQAGVARYFTKPYNDHELLHTLRLAVAA